MRATTFLVLTIAFQTAPAVAEEAQAPSLSEKLRQYIGC